MMSVATESMTLQVREDLTIQLRRAADEDLSIIARIYDEELLHSTISFDEQPRTDDEWRHWLHELHGDHHPVWVVLLDGVVVGWASLSRTYPKSGYRFTATPAIYLDRPAQHKGLGRALLSFLEDEGQRLGMHAFVCDICTEKEAVGRLLTQMDYLRVGVLREVGYKFERRLDVALYQKLVK